MFYPYKCNNCKDEATIVKDAKDSCREEICKECGQTLVRVYTAGGIKTSDGIKS